MRYILTTIIFIFAILPFLGFRETTDSKIVAVLGLALVVCAGYLLYRYLLQDERNANGQEQTQTNLDNNGDEKK